VKNKSVNSMMNSKVVLGVVFIIMRLSFISSLSQIPNNSLSEDDNDKTFKLEDTTMLSTQLFSLSSSFISSSSPLAPTIMTTSNSSEIEEISLETMTNTTITPELTKNHVEFVTKPAVQNVSTTNNLITITLSASNSSIVSIIDKTTPSTTKLISTSTIDFKVPENCSDYKVSQMQTDSISL
jgi:hypothetical protein